MARRPVFFFQPGALVQESLVEFKWFPGMAISQARKSIASLHQAAEREIGRSPILEISSKSDIEEGVLLSAFNLRLTLGTERSMTVEAVYQASKVFGLGDGPYEDILFKSSLEAKRDPRVRRNDLVVEFRLFGESWPTEPKTAFYDWLYLKALSENPELANVLLEYQAFTDIAFNPKKSFNCQARAAALYVSLVQCGRFEEVLDNRSAFLEILQDNVSKGQTFNLLED